METQQENNTTATIKVDNINWYLDPHGFLVSDLLFDEVTIRGEKLNSFPMGLTDIYEHHPVGIGSIVTLSINDESKLKITNSTKEDVSFPYDCLACGSNYVRSSKKIGDQEHFGLKCSNPMCEWKVTTPLYRLIELCTNMSTEEISEWANAFPNNYGTKLGADNLISFIPLFTQIGKKSTYFRHNVLTNTYGTLECEKYYKLETKLEELLDEGLSLPQFWYVSGIIGIGMSEAIQFLSDVKPTSFNIDALITKGMPTELIDNVIIYADRWELLSKKLKIRTLHA
jgi:hypothetical protein